MNSRSMDVSTGDGFSTDRSQGTKLKKKKSFLSKLNVFKWRKKKKAESESKIGPRPVSFEVGGATSSSSSSSSSSEEEAPGPRRDSLMQDVDMDFFSNVGQPKPRRLGKPVPKERDQSLKPIPGSPKGSDTSKDEAPAGLTRWREFSSLHNVTGEVGPKDQPETPQSSKESLTSSEDDACKSF